MRENIGAARLRDKFFVMIGLAVTGPKLRTDGRERNATSMLRSMSPIPRTLKRLTQGVSVKMKKEDVSGSTQRRPELRLLFEVRIASTREYLNITYRTDAGSAWQASCPSRSRSTSRWCASRSCACPTPPAMGQLCRVRAGPRSRSAQGGGRRIHVSGCTSTTCRQLPAGRETPALSRRSSARQNCSSIPIRWWARWTTARCSVAARDDGLQA